MGVSDACYGRDDNQRDYRRREYLGSGSGEAPFGAGNQRGSCCHAADRLVGIVSEGDLLHRVETGTERVSSRRRSWWLDTIASDQELARDYVKSHGRAARDVMTREVVSVTEKTDLAEIAMLLETKRIKRVPVLRDGKLVGIVSR